MLLGLVLDEIGSSREQLFVLFDCNEVDSLSAPGRFSISKAHALRLAEISSMFE